VALWDPGFSILINYVLRCAVNKTDAAGKSVVADEFFSVLIKSVEVGLVLCGFSFVWICLCAACLSSRGLDWYLTTLCLLLCGSEQWAVRDPGGVSRQAARFALRIDSPAVSLSFGTMKSSAVEWKISFVLPLFPCCVSLMRWW
jgi:hypothetical protein